MPFLLPVSPLLECPSCWVSLCTPCLVQENPLWSPLHSLSVTTHLTVFHYSHKYITSHCFIWLLSSFMLIPPFQWRLLKVRDQVWCFVSPPSHPPPYLHNADHIKGIQWILVYSNPIIVGNLLSDLWMSKFSIFNFLFVFVTQWRSIVLNCIQNFCLQSTVCVMSCRPKNKKNKNCWLPENIFYNIIIGNSCWYGTTSFLWLNFEHRFMFSEFLLESTFLSCKLPKVSS